MKRCPKCDFSFVNFHRVCDFDGTDLIDDPDTLPVSPTVSALVAATQPPLLGQVKSPAFLTVLVIAGLVSSALLIGYYDAATQVHSIAASESSQESIVSLVPPAQITTQGPATSRSETSIPAKELPSTRERSVTASRSRARLRSAPAIRNQPSRPEIALQKESKESALQRDSKENAHRKESKLTATLKSTWRILKKPFKF
jgi:hypothetical protein